jgi:hypothetical protein
MKVCGRDSLLYYIQVKYFVRSMFFAILCELKAPNCNSAIVIMNIIIIQLY